MDLIRRLEELRDTSSPHDLLSGRWSLSYGDALRRAWSVAALFEERGLKPGDILAVGVRDDAEVTVLFLACLVSGVVPVFIDADATASEVKVLLGRIEIRLALVEQDLAGRWELSADDHPVLVASWPQKKLLSRWKKRASNGDADTYPGCLKTVGARPRASFDPEPEHWALLLYTSGTTAGPKLVPLTRANLAAQARTMTTQLRLDPDCRVLNLMPITHVDGLLTGILTTFWSGATMVRLEPFTVPRLPAVLDAVYQQRATHVVLVPTLLSLMMRLENDTRTAFDHPDFRCVISTAATLSVELWQSFEELARQPVANMYGMSEIGNLVFAGPDPATARKGSIGAPNDCEVRIVDDADHEVPDGETGELLVRGPSVTPGYVGMETPWRVIDGAPWFPTGDLVVRHEDGTLDLVGRKKELIITAGHNVAPDEVNQALLTHPTVIEAATLGVADDTWGERIVSFVVADAAFDTDSVLEHVARLLAPFKVPRELYRADALPRNRSGKVVLAELRQRLDDPDHGSRTEEADVLEPRVLDLASRVFRTPRESLTAASGPDQCVGWDSMAHLDFVLQLERAFGVSIPPRDVMCIRSLANAVDVVRSHRDPASVD